LEPCIAPWNAVAHPCTWTTTSVAKVMADITQAAADKRTPFCVELYLGCPHLPPFWHAGTERPIHRPKDPEEQPDPLSWQAEVPHGQNLLVIHESCHMCFLSATYEGKVHDTSVAALAGSSLPAGRCLYQDMGFQGCILNGISIVQPKKKPRGGELPPPETATNRRIASISIRIDHAMGGMKRDRI